MAVARPAGPSSPLARTPDRTRRPRSGDWIQPAVLVGSLVPLALLGYRAATGGLGPDPVATALNQMGLLALLFLMASLSCTPLKIVLGFKWPLKVRKTLGLLAFFTALGHLSVYVVVDQGLALGTLAEDVLERPFIVIGLSALLTMLPLALTSTKRALQRLGPKRWQRLHRLAYVAAVLGVIHFVMRVKQDVTEPLIYGSILLALFAMRAADALMANRTKHSKHTAPRAPA